METEIFANYIQFKNYIFTNYIKRGSTNVDTKDSWTKSNLGTFCQIVKYRALFKKNENVFGGRKS